MSVLDLEVLDTLECDLGAREVVAEVLRLFLDLLPQRQRAVAEAARRDDLPRLQREAHVLGSACAVVGARQLRARCQQLESVDTGAGAAGLDPLLRAWASSCRETGTALAAWLDASCPHSEGPGPDPAGTGSR